MKKISILVTSYNLENYIDNSIRSVVTQQMPCDWELLVGDDGSTDKTVERIKAWEEQYPQNIRLYQWAKSESHSMNGFRSATNRANLLERATGDYIIYLDGDDCWLGNDKLKKQFEILESKAYADCSCCGHNILKVVENGECRREMISKKVPQRKFTKQQYYRCNMYIHTNTILFRACCKELMLDQLYKGFLNDIFITFCMLQYGKMIYIPDTYAQYNITGTGLWTGAKKVFSMFRNVHLYDLEAKIDPKFERTIFDSLCGNVLVILNDYKKEDIPAIEPLVKGLDPDVFKYTLSLYKLEGLTNEEIEFKKQLRRRILISRIRSKMYRICNDLVNAYIRKRY